MGRGTGNTSLKKMRTGALLCERRQMVEDARGRQMSDAERLRSIDAELGERLDGGAVARQADLEARLASR